MLRRVMIGIGVLALLGVVTVGGFLIWSAIIAGSGEASEEISAPTLEAADASDAEDADSADEAGDDVAAGSSRTLFRITQDESEVRFNIDETLRGERITVVGTTDQVAGDIGVNFDNPSASQVGTIRINVRTLSTDSSLRNNAIRGQILQSSRDEFEFAEFVPSSIDGLPDSVAVGDTVTFTITGDLTVRDITNTVTFETTVTVTNETRIEGLATATVLRDDYNLSIPSVPQVADVAEEVILEIDFVALVVDAT